MKILHVHKYYHAKDGAGRYMFDLMRLLEGAGHITAGFAMEDPRNAPSAWEKYFVSPMDTSAAPRGFGSLKQFQRALWSGEAKAKMSAMLDAFQPDVVHAHNLYTHLSPSVLAACRERGIPVVMTVHDYALVSADYTLQGNKRFVKGSTVATLALEAITQFHKWFGYYDRAVAQYLPVSDFVKDVLVDAGYPKEKMTVISPCIPPALMETPAGVSAERENAVLFAGRLEEYKGVSTLLKAAALLPKIRFYVAGTGGMLGQVEAFAKTHPHVEYTGFLSAHDLWERMARVKAVLIPSVWKEPFGFVALEALAVGTPVVVSDVGGLSELVKKSEGGMLVPPGDPALFAQTITSLLMSPDYARMGERGKAYVRAHHAPEVFLREILSVYKRVS